MFRAPSIVNALASAVVVAVTAVASAATPEEEAAFREEARRLTEQARGLEQSAAVQRDNAMTAFILEFKKADGLDDQATAVKVRALQRWLQAGADDQVKAVALRETARSLVLSAYQSVALALLADEEVANQGLRGSELHDAAASLLAGTPDAETTRVARELDRLGDKDEREGRSFENQAARLRETAERTLQRAEALIAKAIELESAP
jgi:hypothetical protein